jgi:hypothetical protein
MIIHLITSILTQCNFQKFLNLIKDLDLILHDCLKLMDLNHKIKINKTVPDQNNMIQDLICLNLKEFNLYMEVVNF